MITTTRVVMVVVVMMVTMTIHMPMTTIFKVEGRREGWEGGGGGYNICTDS